MFLLLLGVLVCFLRCNIFDGRGLFRLELRGGFRLDRFDVDLCRFLRLCGGVDFDGFNLDFCRLLRLNHGLGLDNDFGLDGGLGSAFCHVRSWRLFGRLDGGRLGRSGRSGGRGWRIGLAVRCFGLLDLTSDRGVFDHRRHGAFVRPRFLSSTLDDRVGDQAGEQTDRTYRVVVAGDDVVYDLGVAVGVRQRQDRDLEPVGLLDQQFLSLGVYNEDRTRKALHLSYAGEVAPQLLVLAVEGEPVLAAPIILWRLVDPDSKVLEVLDARQNGLEVSKHTADVALRHERLPAPQGLFCQRNLGLLLGPDEEDLAVRLGDAAHEVQRPPQKGQRLVQIDDVNPGPLGEDVALHLGVPALGLMPEVDAGLQQLPNSYALARALQDLYLSFQVVGSSARTSQSTLRPSGGSPPGSEGPNGGRV